MPKQILKLLLLLLLLAATKPGQAAAPARIVSLSGTISEMVCDLGHQADLVGVDVTSTYPATLATLPKVGHTRSISAEGVLALRPTLVLGTTESIKPEVAAQLRSAGVSVQLFKQEYSVAGTKKLVQEVASLLGATAQVPALTKKLDADLTKVQKPTKAPKVLFVYARGTGTMMVAGQGTSVEKVIQLAGGQNAAVGFSDFKPLTAEALVAANPDYLLLFDSGLESLGGKAGLLQVPGVAQTTAGRTGHIIEMDGQLLTGFGPRLGQAAAELARLTK
ncbi:heme/hemin ABC transporter substrate-binding protein [Hymenobacter profundi]|uniref:Helical backbone metal receptor n=1 Tax=Hymenobacter profundi TaxID=1982110 RepID=A0ABS6WZ84_9BACT|nr:helical backbone metal receptor [Hymenobacter profundi]MBW3128500.1 helical backbone metal receptor [Hymenobacter profundi]MBW3128537.1 helical backbone metal receptor [Hymenobacter profundi]